AGGKSTCCPCAMCKYTAGCPWGQCAHHCGCSE
uniref:Delta-actitoxin-Eqd1a n=1 Tax=Entacmaea quadricolor TaxID=6118 RepID=STX3_ENTQU|nr:RecName: Full=Delta-actitoxin-Eqd1a; Short=Delta-AITX-Eqd1a; AltName: Full=Delta-actitoxin-Ers1a; Short=Delta-AITX-Ers1a; AltName: Full=Er-I; Short=Er I; AltName: Full=Neurotoxin 3 homolog; AltName: Full=Neurotoxin III homolog; AltName: Full=Parasicyonis toxin; Short=PATX [Entacmaea quadricolor]